MVHEAAIQDVLWVAQVSLVQADNFSWFGYPDDTEPSARNLLPGLAKARPLLPGSGSLGMAGLA
jgi:hypothetical protein